VFTAAAKFFYKRYKSRPGLWNDPQKFFSAPAMKLSIFFEACDGDAEFWTPSTVSFLPVSRGTIRLRQRSETKAIRKI
jgi:hypothetical protein